MEEGFCGVDVYNQWLSTTDIKGNFKLPERCVKNRQAMPEYLSSYKSLQVQLGIRIFFSLVTDRQLHSAQVGYVKDLCASAREWPANLSM